MQSVQTYTLNYHSFKNPESVEIYRSALKHLNCESAYYRYELLNSGQNEYQELQFFLFDSSEDGLLAVMPFLMRKVILKGKETGYFDVSSPWGYNGPFFKSDISKEDRIGFWNTLDTWYSDNKVVSEFLRFNFFENYEYYTGTVVHTLLNVKGDITDWDTFWSNLKSNTRNQFRKADKTGLEFGLFYEDIDEEKIKDFYKVYIGTMDRRDAIDSFYHPVSYFIEFWKANPKKCAIGLVYHENKPISGELFLISENTMYSFLGGTDSDYFKLRPNEYLKINAVKWAHGKGMEYYMIGGGLSNGPEDKLYQYKKKYFPLDADIDFYTGRKIILSEAYQELVAMSTMDTVGSECLENIETGFFPRYRAAK